MTIPNLTITEAKQLEADEYYTMLAASILIEEEEEKRRKEAERGQ